MLRHLRLPAFVVVALLGGHAAARACNIPVFRYALERWKADAYEAILFHAGGADAKTRVLSDRLGKVGSLNLKVRTADVRSKLDPDLESIWKAQSKATTPWLVVRYPKDLHIPTPVHAGPADEPTIDRLLDSPARRELAKRLLEGETAVWVVLECGKKAEDDAVAALLQKELGRLEKELKLPTDEKPPANVLVSPLNDPGTVQLLSDLPLRVGFSVQRVSRQSAHEKLFVATFLQAADPELVALNQPIAIPIFGRGRALEPFAAEDLDAEAIKSKAAFLCGACSCSVKTLNPGIDLLIAANWESILKDKKTPEPPPTASVAVPIPIPKAPPVDVAPIEAPVPSVESRSRIIEMVLATAGGLCLIAGIGAVYRSRKPRAGADHEA